MFSANQHTAGVSVVRVGGDRQNDGSIQTGDGQDDENPHINLTVEGFYPPGSTNAINSTANALAASTASEVAVPTTTSIISNSSKSSAAVISSTTTANVVSPPAVPPVADGQSLCLLNLLPVIAYLEFNFI